MIPRKGGQSLLIAALLYAVLLVPVDAQADDPVLAVQLIGGDTSVYPIAEVTRLAFEEDSLVVVSSLGADKFATDEIERVEFLWTTSGIDSPEEMAAAVRAVHLFRNRPNPFSPETRIDFQLPQAGQVELEVFSVNGRLVRALVREERIAGIHSVLWDGRDDSGQKVPGGVYFYNLTAPGTKQSRQMILLP